MKDKLTIIRVVRTRKLWHLRDSSINGSRNFITKRSESIQTIYTFEIRLTRLVVTNDFYDRTTDVKQS